MKKRSNGGRGTARCFAGLALAALLAACTGDDSTAYYDYLILGGTLVDGSGKPGYRADIGIAGSTIAEIGELKNAQAGQIVDARGKYVIPGFIDLHGHADDQQGHWRGMRSPDPERRAAPAHVSQGITTSVANSDGLSPLMSLEEQIAEVQQQDFALNLAYMAAHARIRFEVLGADSARPATPAETARMRALLRADLEAGGWGLSSVLEMRDGVWTTTEELIALTSALNPYDGVFIAHPRSQSRRPSWWVPSRHADRDSDYPWAPSMFEASEELIRVAETNDIRVSISHISMRGPDPERDVVRTVEAVNEARDRGVPIFADMHVYRANPLGVFGGLIPFWAAIAGMPSPTFHIRPSDPHRQIDFQTGLRETVADPSSMAALREDIVYLIEFWGGAGEIVVTDYPNRSLVGKSLQQLASEHEVSPVDMALTMALEGFPHVLGGVEAYGNFRSEENIALFVAQPWIGGDTDGYTTRPGDPGYLHPRFYGAYPAWIRRHVLEKEDVELAFAIRSLTGLAAEILGLEDRGLIRKGLAADLSVIDLERVRPTADFFDVHRFSQGFEFVFINGTPVVADGELTWARPGRVLRKAVVSQEKNSR